MIPRPSEPCPECAAEPWRPHNEGCPWLARIAELVRHARSELRPQFVAAVVLDGDDYPPTATAVVHAALERALEQLHTDGVVRAYSLREVA